MKRVVLLILLATMWRGVASAQLTVQLRAEKEVYLLYESIPLTVGLRNTTGRTLELLGGERGGWLDFIMTDEAGRMITPVGQVATEGNVLVPPTQTLDRTVDVMPLFKIRERGSYRVQARVRQGDIHAISAPVAFSVVQGRELWKQSVALPAAAATEEYRTYSLLAHRLLKEDALYVCVQDEPNQLVYGMIALGGLLPLSEPDARIDKSGHLHLLFRGAPHAYAYVHLDPYGQAVERAVYSDKLSRPRLTVSEGKISVAGGTQTYPRPERIMTDSELNPPPAATPLPPPKKWWWPFRPKPKLQEE